MIVNSFFKTKIAMVV